MGKREQGGIHLYADIGGLDRIDGKALAELAKKNFEAKLNCAESISKAVADYFGIGKGVFPRAATPFGGGIGRSGGMCGCVSGALLGIGLLFGRNEAGDHRQLDRTYTITNDFILAFENRFGSVVCRELLNCDIGTDDGRIYAKKERLFDFQCPKYVVGAMELLAEFVARAVRGDFDKKES